MIRTGAALLLMALMAACGGPAPVHEGYPVFQGETMGTYYRVTAGLKDTLGVQASLDSLLRALNLEVSTYIPQSTISRFNQADSLLELSVDPVTGAAKKGGNPHFLANYKAALSIYEKTAGYFDPTVMPLVNYWGFGYTEKRKVTEVDSFLVDSLKAQVGMEKLSLEVYDDGAVLRKLQKGIQLDFSAIAKGYGVDLIGQFLEEKGCSNYLVDIGGEALGKGERPGGGPWKLGINTPEEQAGLDDIQIAVPLRDQALATSGNYRNFYESNGVKYSHTISPKTGYPERNTLLSASVFAPSCTEADALATAFMTMGADKAFELASSMPMVEAYFIVSTEDGSMDARFTAGLASIIQQ